MINNLHQRVYTLLADKPFLGIISGVFSGLLSHEFIGFVGTCAGTTVAILSALVWSARVYDTYKPRCMKMYIRLRPRIIKMKNLFFLFFVIMAMCLFGCKTRHVVSSVSAINSQTDSSLKQTSEVKASTQSQATNSDTGKVYRKSKTTVTATFNQPVPGSAAPVKKKPAVAGKMYTEKELQQFIAGYLASLTITNESESLEQKGSSATSAKSDTKDSTGHKKLNTNRTFESRKTNKDVKSDANTIVRYVALFLFIVFVAVAVYYRSKYNKIATIANYAKLNAKRIPG